MLSSAVHLWNTYCELDGFHQCTVVCVFSRKQGNFCPSTDSKCFQCYILSILELFVNILFMTCFNIAMALKCCHTRSIFLSKFFYPTRTCTCTYWINSMATLFFSMCDWIMWIAMTHILWLLDSSAIMIQCSRDGFLFIGRIYVSLWYASSL